MAVFTFFNSFKETLPEKLHNLGADTLRLAFTLSAPSAANTQLSDITEISYANLDGNPTSRNLTITGSSQTAGVYTLIASDMTLTAIGNFVGPFRYVVLYNDTAAGDLLIGWYDYGTSKRLSNGEIMDINFDGTNGVIKIVS
jgi:hypothetical protein